MTEATGGAARRRRPQWLLLVGGAAGLGLAMTALLGAPSGGELPPDAVARVGDAVIRTDDYQRALAALASDRREPLRDADRRHVLDRLVDEELLVQYGQSLGLARSDRRIRADYVNAVIAALVASVDGFEPTRAEQEAFFQENRDFFRSPGRLWVRSLFVKAKEPAEALARAREAADRLRAGEPFASVEKRFGSAQVAPLPDTPLPPAKLREYLGPSALRVAQQLAPGAVSEPLAATSGARVLQLVAREPGAAPPFDAVADEVRSEMKRRAGDTALRQLLEQLRDDVHVELAEPVP